MIVPTIEAVRAQIPPDALAYARGLGRDWCHPSELRRLRELADQAVHKVTPLEDPEGYQANLQIDWTSHNRAIEIWLDLVKPWTAFSRELHRVTAEDHLVYLVAYNMDRNWAFFEAPKIALDRESHLEDA